MDDATSDEDEDGEDEDDVAPQQHQKKTNAKSKREPGTRRRGQKRFDPGQEQRAWMRA